jgi:hypothetical protein
MNGIAEINVHLGDNQRASARKPKDWPALEQAVEDKIEEQLKFRAWRDANVRDAGQPSKELAEAAANSLPRDEAEKLTGLKPYRVSRLKEFKKFFRD